MVQRGENHMRTNVDYKEGEVVPPIFVNKEYYLLRVHCVDGHYCGG